MAGSDLELQPQPDGGHQRSTPAIVADVPAGSTRSRWDFGRALVSRSVALIRGRALLLVSAVLAMLFAFLTALVLRADLRPTPWDVDVTLAIQRLPRPAVGDLLIAVSAPGFTPWNYALPIALVLILLLYRRYAEAVFTALAASSGIMSEVVKQLVDRPRPTPDLVFVVRELHTYSFPSGHVTGYVTFFGFAFYLAYTRLPRHSPIRWLALIITGALIVLVGPSRVYMGQHWASDALAGYALGFAVLFVVIEAYRLWLRHMENVKRASGT